MRGSLKGLPLVFASILVGVASLGDIAKLGRIGIKTIVYYLTTTAIAITIGLTLANLVRPGSRLDPAIRDRLLDTFSLVGVQRMVSLSGGDPLQIFHNMHTLPPGMPHDGIEPLRRNVRWVIDHRPVQDAQTFSIAAE